MKIHITIKFIYFTYFILSLNVFLIFNSSSFVREGYLSRHHLQLGKNKEVIIHKSTDLQLLSLSANFRWKEPIQIIYLFSALYMTFNVILSRWGIEKVHTI